MQRKARRVPRPFPELSSRPSSTRSVSLGTPGFGYVPCSGSGGSPGQRVCRSGLQRSHGAARSCGRLDRASFSDRRHAVLSDHHHRVEGGNGRRSCRLAEAKREFRRSGMPAADAIAGFHIEGPRIARDGPRGAHPARHVRPPDGEEFNAGRKPRVVKSAVTLSPEYPEAPRYISALVDAGIVVSIGHTERLQSRSEWPWTRGDDVDPSGERSPRHLPKPQTTSGINWRTTG